MHTEPSVNTAEPPRKRKGELRKQELIEATIDVLARKGYASLTLADVAAAAGVSPSLIVVHFKGKQRLLLETLRQLAGEYHESWRRALSEAGPAAPDRLWALIQADFSEAFCSPRKIRAWRAFWFESDWRKPYTAEFSAPTMELYGTQLELCRQIIADGGYEDRDAETVARQIDALSGGLWNEVTTDLNPMTVEQARQSASAHLAFVFPEHFTLRGPK
jgi:TetR/AcrR family transcriptional repressor of bet genes